MHNILNTIKCCQNKLQMLALICLHLSLFQMSSIPQIPDCHLLWKDRVQCRVHKRGEGLPEEEVHQGALAHQSPDSWLLLTSPLTPDSCSPASWLLTGLATGVGHPDRQTHVRTPGSKVHSTQVRMDFINYTGSQETCVMEWSYRVDLLYTLHCKVERKNQSAMQHSGRIYLQCRVQSAECRVQSAECRVQSAGGLIHCGI